jgi:3'(2'), 5'-bisphosphate nucleotidase
MSDYNGYLNYALHAALRAGREILTVYDSEDFNVEQKADNSPLTLADRRAHAAIEAALTESGIPLLSEEGADIDYAERRRWQRYWLIDPLDGTKEFIKRNGEFTVNIALMEHRREEGAERWIPVLGTVYVPAKDLLYAGAFDKGAFKLEQAKATLSSAGDAAELLQQNGGRLAGRPADEKKQIAAVVSRSHGSEETEAFVEQLRRRYGEIERVSSGSSIKLCLVAEGAADAYPRFAPTMEWDTAAGDAVCRAAGCRVTERDGAAPLAYNKEDLHNPWFLVLGRRIEGASNR